MLRAKNLRGRDDLVLYYLLLVVEGVEEEVEGGDPLDEAGLEARPFVRRDYARDEVEREDALGPLGVVVHGEGHPAAQEREVHRGPPALELGQRQRAQALDKAAVVRAHHAVGLIHLVEEFAGVVGVA